MGFFDPPVKVGDHDQIIGIPLLTTFPLQTNLAYGRAQLPVGSVLLNEIEFSFLFPTLFPSPSPNYLLLYLLFRPYPVLLFYASSQLLLTS